MKKKFKKFYNVCLGLIPVCACFVMTALVNSTGCWLRGQDELPAGAKKYRKF